MSFYSILLKISSARMKRKTVGVWLKLKSFLIPIIDVARTWQEWSSSRFNRKEEITMHHQPFSNNCKKSQRRY